MCPGPTGPPPPGYDEYILISSNSGFPADPYDTYPYDNHHPNGGHSNVESGNISMPPSAFTHMMDSQVRTVELATGYRSPRYNHNHTKPYFPRRGGIIRGHGNGNRGTCGRPIPGGIGINRRARPSNREEEEEVPRIQGPPNRPAATAPVPPTSIAPVQSTSSAQETPNQAEGSRFRDSNADSGKELESNADSIGTLSSSDSAFLRIRNIPAEETESALTARMTALQGHLSEVSVEEDRDDDMKDAEGDPASDVEAVKN